jgi:hypothetical protein
LPGNIPLFEGKRDRQIGGTAEIDADLFADQVRLRISFGAMTLNGNLLSAAATMAMSPPRKRMGIDAVAEP